MKSNLQYRWIGLSSYEESDSSLFFGRSKEILELSSDIQFNIQTIIYGPSGIGKTSIIRAGIFEDFRKKGFLPVYIRINVESEIPYTQQIISAIEEALRNTNGEKEVIVEGADSSLWEYFHGNQFWDSSNYPLTPLIVLDQFEELYTLSAKQDKIDDFFVQLSDLCDAKMPKKVKEKLNSQGIRSPYLEKNDGYRLVISLREDFLPRLEECSNEIPAFKHNRYSLQALTEEQAMEIVLNPGEGIVTEDVASAIISKLSYKSNYKIAGARNKIVEPALLSLFCHELDKRRIARNELKISKSLLNEWGDNIINDYYNDTISNISVQSAEYLEDVLMTKDGFRDNVSVQDALSSGLTKDELNYLLQSRLIREEEWSGVKRLEYTHDILCKVAKARRDNREEEKRIEEEKKENERLQKKLHQRNKRNQILFFAVGSLIALIAGIYWAFFFHKVAYYEDVVLCYEWPEGINSISESQVKHRPLSYKLEKKGALCSHWTTVTAVNGLLLPNVDNAFNQVFLETDANSLRNLDKKYQKMLKTVVSWEFISDASNSNIIQQKAYNKKGELIYSFSFTDNKIIDGKLRGCVGLYTNAAGYPIQSYKNGANNVKITLDENGYRCKVDFYDAWGNRDRDNNCVYTYKMESSSDGLLQEKGAINEKGIYVYDSQNNSVIKYLYKNSKLTEQQYCNPQGKLENNNYGYAVEKNEYDNENRLSKKSYYDQKLNKALISKMQKAEYHAIMYTYDSRGFISEITYLDVNNNPIKQGFAHVSYENNDKGMIGKCRYYTYDGSSFVCADSISGYSNEYNDPNDYALVTFKTNLGETGEPTNDASGVVSYKYEYDDKGNILSVTNLNNKGESINNNAGYAKAEYQYDDNSNLISCRYLAQDNSLTINKEKGYSIVDYAYDSRDNLIKESFMDEHGMPTQIGNAQTYLYEYDRFSNKTKTICKNKDGKNVTEGIITKNTFDPFGNIVLSENFKSDEKTPVNGIEGWQRKETQYDINKFKTDEIFYDVNGFVINTPGKPYAIKHSENDEFGKVVSISYLDDMMEPISYEGKYKDTLIYESNKLVKSNALDKNSNVTISTEFKYDDKQRLSEVAYKDKDGKSTQQKGFTSKAIEYSEHGDVIITYLNGEKVAKKDTIKEEYKFPFSLLMESNMLPVYKVLKTKNWKYEGYMLNNEPCGVGKFTWYEAGYFIEGYFNGWNVVVNSLKSEEENED